MPNPSLSTLSQKINGKNLWECVRILTNWTVFLRITTGHKVVKIYLKIQKFMGWCSKNEASVNLNPALLGSAVDDTVADLSYIMWEIY